MMIVGANEPTLEQCASRINAAFAKSDAGRIEAGRALIEAKALVAAGQWRAWLGLNVNRSLRDCSRVMKIALAADPNAALSEERAQNQKQRYNGGTSMSPTRKILRDKGKNPARLQRQQLNAKLYRQLREAVVNLTSLPMPGDVLPIVLAQDRGIVDPKLVNALNWLREFCDEWERAKAARNGTRTEDRDTNSGERAAAA